MRLTPHRASLSLGPCRRGIQSGSWSFRCFFQSCFKPPSAQPWNTLHLPSGSGIDPKATRFSAYLRPGKPSENAQDPKPKYLDREIATPIKPFVPLCLSSCQHPLLVVISCRDQPGFFEGLFAQRCAADTRLVDVIGAGRRALCPDPSSIAWYSIGYDRIA